MAHKKEAWKDECYGDAVRDRILAFAEEGFESVPEDERDAWFSRFKFWGLFHQRSGQEGYFMMRIANADGVLRPGQLTAVAEVARDYAVGPVANPEFGNGWIDLTSRQSIQLHWIRLADVPAIWKKLEAVGVSTRSSGGDAMRNITGSPVAGKDAREVIDTRPLLERLSTDLRGDDALSNLPRKFNIGVSGVPDGSAQDAINDVGLEPARQEVDGEAVIGYNVRVGGGLGGKQPRVARPLDVFVTPEEAYEVVRGFVRLYRDHGDRQRRARNRTRFLVDEWGTDRIRDLLDAEYVDFDLRPAGEDFRERYEYNAGSGTGDADLVGVNQQRDGDYFVGLTVPVGRLPARDALALADLAEAYGSGEIRLTRRQNPLLVDVPESNVADLLAEPLLERYPAEPTPFQRGGMACTGTEFCSLALTETKTRLARLLRWLNANVDLPPDVEHLHVHFSGCTADCGHAHTADIGLLGMRGRKDGELVEALDVGVGGGMGEEPGFVTWIRQRVPADEVPGALRNLIEAFVAERSDGESFREWVAATDEEALTAFCEPEETDYEDPAMYDAKGSWYPFADDSTPARSAVDGAPTTSDD
ncbi:nitrite/sulfite reductase [Halomarina pelagica]|uniref:nitrite/sulfite reductase n=1 Tax=Halomarina pelagica TaxID=2961599 RepID=UPI0020C54AB0|nr:ferredoxin--nitrite reductase [Halomarina sp. BND7]